MDRARDFVQELWPLEPPMAEQLCVIHRDERALTLGKPFVGRQSRLQSSHVVLDVVPQALEGSVWIIRLFLAKVSFVLADPPIAQPAWIKLLVEFPIPLVAGL